MTNWSFKIISAINLNQTILTIFLEKKVKKKVKPSEKAPNYKVFTGKAFRTDVTLASQRVAVRERSHDDQKVCAKVFVDKKQQENPIKKERFSRTRERERERESNIIISNKKLDSLVVLDA